ncbi:MAG: amino acid--tRNA ligase-related protein [Phycisphaerae bacterium]
MLRIRHTPVDEIRGYFNRNGYTLIDTPICARGRRGAQTLFAVDYFGEPVYLAQTGQLYVESACMAFGKVYCFGPTFRAEKSKTRRHLTEFWMVEPEIAYADLDAVIGVAEDFICSIVQRAARPPGRPGIPRARPGGAGADPQAFLPPHAPGRRRDPPRAQGARAARMRPRPSPPASAR